MDLKKKKKRINEAIPIFRDHLDEKALVGVNDVGEDKRKRRFKEEGMAT